MMTVTTQQAGLGKDSSTTRHTADFTAYSTKQTLQAGEVYFEIVKLHLPLIVVIDNIESGV